MTIQANEALQQQTESVELFTFTYYNGTILRYTSYSEDVVITPYTYTKAAIERGSIAVDAALNQISCIVSATITNVFAQLVADTPLLPTRVQIKKYFLSDMSTFMLVFDGYISNVTIKGRVCSVKCVAYNLDLNKQIPRFHIQSVCNNCLFDAQCTLVANTYNVPASATQVGSVLSSATYATKPDDYFTSGKVIYAGEPRFITKHTGSDLYLHYPFTNYGVGAHNVATYPGCDKKLATCQTKFGTPPPVSNQAHFQGMPYLPVGAIKVGNWTPGGIWWAYD